MGFTVVGPDRFLGSGHPDGLKDPDLPPFGRGGESSRADVGLAQFCCDREILPLQSLQPKAKRRVRHREQQYNSKQHG